MGFACLGLWILGLEIRYQGLSQQRAGLRSQFRKSAQTLGVTLPATLDSPAQAEKWLAQQQTYRQEVRAHSVAVSYTHLAPTTRTGSFEPSSGRI